ncbi:hypothetical protein FKW77_006524 [Venturia effusa]|uniref:Uncharacterized protein n=1 Tax=Venturia effusa TaxID=50376 RepID=A0A517LKE8_9PEZI|nr:hypothetical protein FKW77_006524 [Venturia effusa]
MSDRDYDRDRYRDRDQRDFTGPQDSKTYKYHDSKHQNTPPYKYKSPKYEEEWVSRPRDRDVDTWGRGRVRRSRSPTRFGYRQDIGRLSPTPYEPAYRTDRRKRNPAGDGEEDEMPGATGWRVQQDSSDSVRARLEAQIMAMTKEELSFEIDSLIQNCKEEADLDTRSAREMMKVKIGDGGDVGVWQA